MSQPIHFNEPAQERIGVYVCHCGTNISATVNVAEVRDADDLAFQLILPAGKGDPHPVAHEQPALRRHRRGHRDHQRDGEAKRVRARDHHDGHQRHRDADGQPGRCCPGHHYSTGQPDGHRRC